VQACQRLGYRAPLDVRWARLKRVAPGPNERPSLFSLRAWKQLFGLALPWSSACRCGGLVAGLRKFRFVLGPRKKLTCVIGQCPRCGTIHWDEA
jgi:hypothetical protein